MSSSIQRSMSIKYYDSVRVVFLNVVTDNLCYQLRSKNCGLYYVFQFLLSLSAYQQLSLVSIMVGVAVVAGTTGVLLAPAALAAAGFGAAGVAAGSIAAGWQATIGED